MKTKFKVLYKSLSARDRSYLGEQVCNFDESDYTISNHAIRALRNRKFEAYLESSRYGVQELLFNTLWEDFNIVEVHNLKGTLRVLVRGNIVVGDSNPCFILDLTTRTVVTIYFNKVGDNHETLNKDEYFGEYHYI